MRDGHACMHTWYELPIYMVGTDDGCEMTIYDTNHVLYKSIISALDSMNGHYADSQHISRIMNGGNRADYGHCMIRHVI